MKIQVETVSPIERKVTIEVDPDRVAKELDRAYTGLSRRVKLRGFRPKPGEAYGRIEAPKGELGFYVISDGSPNPYRYRVRPPSFINLTPLGEMCKKAAKAA